MQHHVKIHPQSMKSEVQDTHWVPWVPPLGRQVLRGTPPGHPLDLDCTFVFLLRNRETYKPGTNIFEKLLSLREFRRPILSDLVARLVFVCMLVCLLLVFSIDFVFSRGVF